MTVPNTTYRILTEKLGDSDPAQFIGNEGEVFYDPNSPELKLSDGSTPGGILIAGGGSGAVETAGYRGFSAFVNRFWGDDPSINQIVIYKSFWEDGYDSGYETKPIFWNSTTDTDVDDFGVGGIKTSNIICIINVYGAVQEVNENSDKSPVPIANLQNFVKKFVDVALYDENGYIVDNIETAVQAFYDNIDALKATLPPLYENFEFDLLDDTNNISDGGDDQYDGGNYINSRGNDGSENLEIPYGDGTNVLNDYFGNGSAHKTFYQDSIWGMVVYDAAVDSVWYTGNIGADGYGNKQSEVLIGSSDNVNYVRYPKHNIGNNNYTLALSDAGRFIYADNNTITIPYNYDAPFPVGTEIKIVTQSVGSMVQIDGGSTYLYVNGTYESGFILPPRCIASLLKVEEEVWTIEVSAGGSSSQWTTETNGIYYESRVAIGTTAVGAGSTVLYVEGDARITGILTVGTASITLDGSNNLINVGPQVSIDGNVGVVTATAFYGDGSGLVGIVTNAVGTEIYEDGNVRGTATCLNFGNGFNVDPVSASCANVNIGLDGGGNFSVGGGSGGNYNNFLGLYAGLYNQTGSYNNFLGVAAGRSNTTGRYNNFFGEEAGKFNTTGSKNNFLGYSSGCCNTTGSYNNFFGSYAGYASNTGVHNNFLGAYAGYCNSCGDDNTFIGRRSGYNNIDGSCNNFIGYYAGYCNTSGQRNIFIGESAGRNNINGYDNIFVGCNAGYYNTCGLYNNFFGRRAGYFNTEGRYNNFFGFDSGYGNTTGRYNNFFGKEAGSTNTTGCYNDFIGTCAGYYNTTGICNIFIGFRAGCCNTTADRNIAIGAYTEGPTTGIGNFLGGYAAGYAGMTTSSYNNFIGWYSGGHGDQGVSCCNNFIGYHAGGCNNNGCNNNFMGSYVGYCNTGSCNTFIGYYAGYCNTSGQRNTFIGSKAGRQNSTGSHNVAIGDQAGFSNTTGSYNFFGGYYNAYYNGYTIEGDSNIFIGRYTGGGTTATENIAFGCYAGAKLTSGSCNFFVGRYAGYETTTGNHNNFIGLCAGCSNTTGCNNNFFGACAGRQNTTGDYNNFFGTSTGYNSITGCYNNLYGYYVAACCSDIGKFNNIMGYEAACMSECGFCNNIFGLQAGFNNTGCNNNFFGSCAGYYNSGSYNNFFGQESGKFNTCGSNNNFLGYSSGCCNVSGNYNNFFGYSSGYNNTSGSHNNSIGNYASACNNTGNYNIFLGAYTGISTASSRKVIIGTGEMGSFALFDSPDTTKDTQLAIGVRTNANPANYWIVGNENFNVGIGTTNPTTKLTVGGDIKAGLNSSQGVILTSPNGTQYRLIVDNSGALSTTLA